MTTDGGTSASIDGSNAYVNFSGLGTDGSGNLVITGFKATNYGAVAALELTAVAAPIPEPSSLALFGLSGLVLLRRKR